MSRTDYERELHGGVDSDAISNGEALAEAKAALQALESGDLSHVPPWMTMDQALEDAQALVQRLGTAAPKGSSGV
jgi:hypothetical protein